MSAPAGGLLEITDTIADILPDDEGTDNSRLTHIVNCPQDKESTAAWLTEARVFGLTVQALCGYEFVPQHNPDKHPVCEPCKTNARLIRANSL